MSELIARLLHWLAAGFARLPWSWLYWLGDRLAAQWIRFDARESRVTRRNLELAYPELSSTQRASLHTDILRTTARQALETLCFWTQPQAKSLALIEQTHGGELFDAALASGRGLIIAAPHYGNWELLNQWLASRASMAFLYRPPESAIGEAFLRRARANRDVIQVRAEGPGIRQLWKILQAGGMVAILPDQQPKAGDGEFAPFFGVPALTMTLLSRLAERTGAIVLFAYCERIGRGPKFALHIESASAELASSDLQASVTALNAKVEQIARRVPAQYQWTYKRYTRRAPGSGETNPYIQTTRPRK